MKLPLRLRLFLSEQKLIYWLIGINIFYFVLTSVLTSIFPTNAALFTLGAKRDQQVLAGEVWRLLAAGFLHANFVHLALNMYSLWIVGRVIEQFYSGRKLWTLYILTAVLANVFSFVVEVVQAAATASSVPLTTLSVGASGALFGLLGLIVGNLLIKRRGVMQLPLDRNQILFIVAYQVIFSFVVPGIDILAHIGGLVAGVGMSFLVEPNVGVPHFAMRKRLEKLLFWTANIMFGLMLIFQVYNTARVISVW